MHLAALVDLGVPEGWLREQLSKLPVTAEFQLSLRAGEKMGISGTVAKVHTQDQHDHRHHSTIVKMIQDAQFSQGIEQRALAIFKKIAEAEGKIHNIEPDKVHFHEVGAIDSIVDIVAAAICIEHFNPDVVICSPVEVGSGYVDCAHGRFPVPAPATQELLSNTPCTYGTVSGESTTPTGAAILAASVDEFQPKGIFSPERIGYGVGHKDFEIPNVLRVVLGTYQPRVQNGSEKNSTHYKIETNIDDMSPEAYAPLIDSLYKAGAVDVYLTAISMKKNRPAQCITAICDATHQQEVSDALLNESTTIGLRVIPFAKQVLPRTSQVIQTSLGSVDVKVVTQPNGVRRWKSEHDDVRALAQANNLDYPIAKTRRDQEVTIYFLDN